MVSCGRSCSCSCRNSSSSSNGDGGGGSKTNPPQIHALVDASLNHYNKHKPQQSMTNRSSQNSFARFLACRVALAASVFLSSDEFAAEFETQFKFHHSAHCVWQRGSDAVVTSSGFPRYALRLILEFCDASSRGARRGRGGAVERLGSTGRRGTARSKKNDHTASD